ncbi:unnamed protein product [Symbiodinium necroappetens]|uniref:Uncharacterized protein n=1 Tax=Symbiodinium necroappetens TaxID=1628268 RepID=A0A812YMP7_9DINO|nr:unnamed protein product [Symbiodinium necroappetens]
MTSAIQFNKASFLSWLVKGDGDEDKEQQVCGLPTAEPRRVREHTTTVSPQAFAVVSRSLYNKDMLLFQGDIMLQGSLVRWRHRKISQAPPAAATQQMRSSTSLQASASNLFKSKGRERRDMRRTNSFAASRERCSISSSAKAKDRARPGQPRLPKRASAPALETQNISEPAKEESLEKEEKQPEASDDAQPEPDDSVQLSGFTGGSASLNGTFVPDGNTVNGKQVYSQSQGDAGLECMWYHNGAWRIGSYNWFNSKELGRCHAYVKTSAQDLGDIAPSETWMSCMGTAGGDPDVDKGLFQPQMSAKAAKLALDSLTRRSTSKKTSQVPVGGSTRLANILADQSWRHDFELPPMTPPSKERAQWRSQGSNEEVANSEAADLPEKPASDS